MSSHIEVGAFETSIRCGEPLAAVERHEVALAVDRRSGVRTHRLEVSIVSYEQRDVVSATTFDSDGLVQLKVRELTILN